MSKPFIVSAKLYLLLVVVSTILIRASVSDITTNVSTVHGNISGNKTVENVTHTTATHQESSSVTTSELSQHSNNTETTTENFTNSTSKDDLETLGTDFSFKDYGTVIESETEKSVVVNADEFVTEDISTNIKNKTGNKIHVAHSWSVSDALKDIAYYLRAYKFNEYDRRYETKAESASRSYFKYFPRPPLRSLHWEVRKFCEPSFTDCIDYLHKRIRHIALKRTDDTVVVMRDQKWTLANNSEQIKQIDEECKKLRNVGDIVAEPFQGPIERYQWRVTASYYMCWYTMQQEKKLEKIFEQCDNFANCLDDTFGSNNKDFRANDFTLYSCALYSFCPDPCCPMKHLNRPEDCWDSDDNPCSRNNSQGHRQCTLNRTSNTDFRDIVLNRWNVSCRCPTGHEWNSRYGMCVDVDECALGRHNCDRNLEGCVNLQGSFRCACIWGHIWNPTKKECTPSEALNLIKLSYRENSEKSDHQSQSLIRKLTKFFRRSPANTLPFDNIVLVFNLLCALLFVLK